MKKIPVLFLALMALLPAFAQKQVLLHVHQLPELKCEANNRDYTTTANNPVVLGNGLQITGGSGIFSFRWSPGKTLNDSTVMSPVATPETSTVYLLTVTDQAGCSVSLDYRVTVLPATPAPLISGVENKLEAEVFPNPGTGLLYVQLTGKPAQDIRLTVIDLTGRAHLTRTLENFDGDQTEQLDLVVPGGIYILRVSTSVAVISRQFIVQ